MFVFKEAHFFGQNEFLFSCILSTVNCHHRSHVPILFSKGEIGFTCVSCNMCKYTSHPRRLLDKQLILKNLTLVGARKRTPEWFFQSYEI